MLGGSQRPRTRLPRPLAATARSREPCKSVCCAKAASSPRARGDDTDATVGHARCCHPRLLAPARWPCTEPRPVCTTDWHTAWRAGGRARLCVRGMGAGTDTGDRTPDRRGGGPRRIVPLHRRVPAQVRLVGTESPRARVDCGQRHPRRAGSHPCIQKRLTPTTRSRILITSVESCAYRLARWRCMSLLQAPPGSLPPGGAVFGAGMDLQSLVIRVERIHDRQDATDRTVALLQRDYADLDRRVERI